MNERDSEAVAAQLVAKGYTLAPSEATADVVLLNTCSVRDLAEQKALNKMKDLAGVAGKERRNPVFGFMGCMAQSRGQKLIDELPDVDLVLGTQKFHRAAEYLDEILSGANGATGFCIVPYTRGEERSRTIGDIVAECRELVSRGVKEITLLGQIVTSYAKRDIPTRDGKSAFVQLLEAVHEIDGLERIRFTSPHPKGYGDDLIDAYARLPKLCESAHIPVQSGSDRILKLMHRGYTREKFLGIIKKLRAARPQIGIGTDIIVGFPGETEQDFEETLSLAREAEFDQAYIFKYSPRRDTPAAEMPDQIPQRIREERNHVLLQTVNEIAARKYESFVGQQTQILVEGPSRTNSERMTGRTRCNKIVVFDGDERHRGEIMDIKIIRAGSFTLYGDAAILE
jgi:tRNA-2-methylthio-N6-dimethylallyladenosine synthase